MHQVDFVHGSVGKAILQSALPMFVAQFFNLLYNIVDRIFIGRIPGEGTAALGGVGLCFPIIIIVLAFSNLFGTGGAPLFSIARGRGDDNSAAKIQSVSFFLLSAAAVVITLLGFSWPARFCGCSAPPPTPCSTRFRICAFIYWAHSFP